MANGLPYFENNIYCRRDDVSQCQPGSLMPPYRTAAIQMTHLFDSSDSPRSQSESTVTTSRLPGLMFSSDSTQLTAFSSAKLWPIYLTFGNESLAKNRRSKLSCQAFECIAYLETVCEVPF